MRAKPSAKPPVQAKPSVPAKPPIRTKPSVHAKPAERPKLQQKAPTKDYEDPVSLEALRIRRLSSDDYEDPDGILKASVGEC